MTYRTLLVAIATSAAILSPAVATQASAQTACTQLESSAGIRGVDCGRLTTAELAVIHTGRAGG